MATLSQAMRGNKNAAKDHISVNKSIPTIPKVSQLKPIPTLKPPPTVPKLDVSNPAVLAAAAGVKNQKHIQAKEMLKKAEINVMHNRSADAGLMRNIAGNAGVAAILLANPVKTLKAVTQAGITTNMVTLTAKSRGKEQDLEHAMYAIKSRLLAESPERSSRATKEAERILKEAEDAYDASFD